VVLGERDEQAVRQPKGVDGNAHATLN
jgi:hypothetical protein